MTGRPTNNSFIKVNKTAQSELEKPFENPEEKSKESTSDNNGEDSIIQDKQTERLNIENGDIIEDMDEDLDQNQDSIISTKAPLIEGFNDIS